MFDAAAPSLQRVRGRAEVVLAGGRPLRIFQQGSAKAMLPRVHGGPAEVLFLNTAGGLTGGDRLSWALAVEGAAVATTQTAERAYRSAGGRAEVGVALSVGAGGALDWLPQETILFEGSALTRRTRIDLGRQARLVFCEMVVLGRRAMGETVARIDLRDRREVWRDGVPVLVEPVALDADALAPRPALLDGARALATVVLVADGAEDALGPVRAALGAPGVRAAASAWDGRCLVRMTAQDGLPLRRAVARVLSVMRRGAPLPRVWQL